MKTAEKVRRLMAEQRWGVRDLAGRLGCGEGELGHVVRGKTRRISAELCLGLARATGVSVEWLIDGAAAWDAPGRSAGRASAAGGSGLVVGGELSAEDAALLAAWRRLGPEGRTLARVYIAGLAEVSPRPGGLAAGVAQAVAEATRPGRRGKPRGGGGGSGGPGRR